MSSKLSGLKPIYRSRLLIIKSLIENYDGSSPFHQFLKNSFSKNRGYGSADRRIYRNWCYSYFRLGNALGSEDLFTRISVAYYLVNGINDDFAQEVILLFTGANLENVNSIELRLDTISKLYPAFSIDQIFPFNEKLSKGIDFKKYCISMLSQPMVFGRTLAGKGNFVEEECRKLSIPFSRIPDVENCLAFNASVNLDNLLSREKGFLEIQDLSSQKTAHAIPAKENEHWWDCCCGAGGKSLLIADKFNGIQLTATDKRDSIIESFEKRLNKNNIQNIKLFTADLIQELPEKISGIQFDGIIADVPCTGSGTWARTPENLSKNKPTMLEFEFLQKAIVSSTIPALKQGGIFVYITCSVFNAENEAMSEWIASHFKLSFLVQESINGIESNSDSMFYAIFRK